MAGHDTLIGSIALGTAGVTQGNALRTIAAGTLIAGTLDISAAIASWALKEVPAIRVLQGVAGGLLGRDAFAGGTPTAALGLLLHFLIMSVIVTAFYVASRKLNALTRQWFWSGVAYGVTVYLIMTFVVVPLSAASGRTPSLPALVQGLLVHVLCVGLPIAFITRRFSTSAHSSGEAQ